MKSTAPVRLLTAQNLARICMGRSYPFKNLDFSTCCWSFGYLWPHVRQRIFHSNVLKGSENSNPAGAGSWFLGPLQKFSIRSFWEGGIITKYKWSFPFQIQRFFRAKSWWNKYEITSCQGRWITCTPKKETTEMGKQVKNRAAKEGFTTHSSASPQSKLLQLNSAHCTKTPISRATSRHY